MLRIGRSADRQHEAMNEQRASAQRAAVRVIRKESECFRCVPRTGPTNFLFHANKANSEQLQRTSTIELAFSGSSA